jgi:probable non-F420 flavinoid oxidoreductase
VTAGDAAGGGASSRKQIGYHASHEQLGPDVLLQSVIEAEQAGFDAAMCSDHFYPWSEEQGESGYAWSWLGAAMQATSLPFGLVCAPGQRYHPAILAQAAATLQVMFPDRLFMAIGSGQFLNEHITGDPWPAKDLRNQRLRECADVIKALWAGETVNHRGLITVEDAKLYTRPARPPLLVGAAVTAETAAFVAGWADALITVWQPEESLARVLEEFRSNGGQDKPVFLQLHVAYAATDEEARAQAHRQWRQNVHPSNVLTEVRTVEQMDALGQNVRPEDMDSSVRISASPQQHVDWLAAELQRFDSVYVHGVGDDQRAFIDLYGSRVMPQVRSTA